MDECAEWVDQYSSAKDPKIARFWSWLRHSSKRSQDVLLIVQRLEYLNKVIRLLISKWVIVDDMRVYRLPVIKMRVPFMGGWCMQRVFDKNKRLIQGPCMCNKSAWGRFYDTAECLNTTGASYNYQYTRPHQRRNLAPYYFAYMLSLFALIASIALRQARSAQARPPARLRASGAALARP